MRSWNNPQRLVVIYITSMYSACISVPCFLHFLVYEDCPNDVLP